MNKVAWAASLGGVLLFFGMHASEAKTVQMGAISRAAMQSACLRAAGTAFGIQDLSAAYGCYSGIAAASCNGDRDGAEPTCIAVVDDMRPVTGNSPSYILGIARSIPSQRIQPVNARVTPLNQSQTGTIQRLLPQR